MTKYLVYQKKFTAEHDLWKREEDLGNAKEMIEDLKEKMSIEVRRWEKFEVAEEQDFRQKELLEKYTAKMLYGQNNKKFKREYLRKLEGNWWR